MAIPLKSTANSLGAWGTDENESVCSLQDNQIRDPEVKRVMDLFSRMEKLKTIE